MSVHTTPGKAECLEGQGSPSHIGGVKTSFLRGRSHLGVVCCCQEKSWRLSASQGQESVAAGRPEHVLLSIWREMVQRREVGTIRRKECLHGKASVGHQLGAGARAFVFLSLIPTLPKTLSHFGLYKLSCLFPWLNPAWLLHCWVKQCPFQRPFSSWRDQYSCLALGFAGSAPAPGHVPSFPLAGTGMTRVSTVLGGMFRICVRFWEQLTSRYCPTRKCLWNQTGSQWDPLEFAPACPWKSCADFRATPGWLCY